MPNHHNADAPITLISAGRSGTSLCAQLFAHHPDCVAVGETANVIFGAWNAVRTSTPYVLPQFEDGRPMPDDERAARAVRQTFVTCFPDERAHWMQKPIGIPKAMQAFDDPAGDDAIAQYWRVLRTTFPRGRFFTILRHPCDAVLSGRAHWGMDEHRLWTALGWMARYLTDAASPVRYAVQYDRLVRDPAGATRELFAAVDMPYQDGVLEAFDTTYVPTPGRERPSASGYSRRADWHDLNPQMLERRHRDAITRLFERFGVELEWPHHLPGVDSPAAAGAGQPDSLRATIAQLRAQLDRVHGDYATRMQAREREVTRLWSEQQAWIAELEKAKAWLNEERLHWRARAGHATV